MTGNYDEYHGNSDIYGPHMPIILVLDISESMAGEPMDMLNRTVNRFKEQVCKNPKDARGVEVLIIGFNDSPTVVQNWHPITDMEPVSLTAGGGTNISLALEMAIKKLRERSHLYEEFGIELKMPYLFLISDGYGGDVTEVAKVIKQRSADHKMKLWVFAVKGYDEKTVAQLTDGKRVFELVDMDSFDFSEFFDPFAVSDMDCYVCGVSGDSISSRNSLTNEELLWRMPSLDSWLDDND